MSRYRYSYKQLADSLRTKGIRNELVLNAIENTPRHMFMAPEIRQFSTEDTALPIEHQQTISQPYVVAKMTEAMLAADIKVAKVLEVGTGSGYQAAILSELVDEVYTIERIKELHQHSDQVLSELQYDNVFRRYGDGYLGWPEAAPFDGIIVTAAAPEIPKALLQQLADGANLVIPIGDASRQYLKVITRHGDEFHTTTLDSVVFVPLLPGKH